jgi:serine/threonine protein kinase
MSQELIGKEIGGYLIQAQIGEGGNGVVYRAIQPKTKKVVAIKILLDPRSPVSNVNRLFEEARAIRQINHPNIVELYDFQTLPDGKPYLVMELLEGENLEMHLKVRRRLRAVEALEICIPVAEALDAAHQKSIIHRDMKPDNIFLVDTPRGRQVKLLDFGIAKFHGTEGKARITQSGMLLGTPQYMSPEQAERPKEVDGRSDLYSLGVILYEMVTGQLPFDSETPIAILFLHFDKAPTPPSKHIPDLSPKMERLILRCLAKSPAGRHPSARAFLKECREILQFEQVEVLKRSRASATSAKEDEPLWALAEDTGEYEDEATNIAPASALEEILELEDADIQTSPPDPSHLAAFAGLDLHKTAEDSGIKPFARNAWLGVSAKPESRGSPSQELAKIISQSKPSEPAKKASSPSEESTSQKLARLVPASTQISPKPTAFKPNVEEPPRAFKPSPSAVPETKPAIPRPNKALSKTQKSHELPAFLHDDDVLTSRSPGPKTIQAEATPEEPSSSGPSTLLMTAAPGDEQPRLRLTITPPDAQVTYWINEVVSRPEKIPAEIRAPKRSMVEIAVVARGFYPKQVTILATDHQEVSITLERPAPRMPTHGAPNAPPGGKR